MQDHTSVEQDAPQSTKTLDSDSIPSPSANSTSKTDDFDSVIDVSGKKMELSLSLIDGQPNTAQGLYVYKNVFNLMPESLGNFGKRLKTLKFFANEVNLFPPEVKDLVDLECLQLKVSPISLSGLTFSKLKTLKELELSKAPLRASGFPILAEVSSLKSLTKLSVCHFSIRFVFLSLSLM